MVRYKVYRGKGTDDFTIIYADNEAEATDKFYEYQPDSTVSKVMSFPKLPDLLTLYEHKYLIAIIEAVQYAGVEDKVVQSLLAKGWGR